MKRTQEQIDQVKWAIEDIALNPYEVGRTHAKILRDEIIRLRSDLANANQEIDRLYYEKELEGA